MRSLQRFLGLSDEQGGHAEVRDAETIRRIAAELEALEPEHARYVAAFSYVLARVAHADWEVSEDEVRTMERLVQEAAALPEPQAALAVEIARSQAVRLGATENYLVTRQFRELSTREQRLGLLECLFGVAAADSNISTAENQAISQIALELGLTHQEVTNVRSAYREHLAVLKDMPKSKGDAS